MTQSLEGHLVSAETGSNQTLERGNAEPASKKVGFLRRWANVALLAAASLVSCGSPDQSKTAEAHGNNDPMSIEVDATEARKIEPAFEGPSKFYVHGRYVNGSIVLQVKVGGEVVNETVVSGDFDVRGNFDKLGKPVREFDVSAKTLPDANGNSVDIKIVDGNPAVNEMNGVAFAVNPHLS